MACPPGGGESPTGVPTEKGHVTRQISEIFSFTDPTLSDVGGC